jgi:hypothetical protein
MNKLAKHNHGWVTALGLLGLTILGAPTSTALAQGTAFTYQGRLNNGTNPATGSYDLTFALYNAGSGGSQIGSTVTNLGVGVTNGLFLTTVDFGAVFTGSPAWVAIGVRTNGSATFTGLSQLQQLTPVPYAITAENANSVAGLTVQQDSAGAPNLIGGSPNNNVTAGSIGATIGGGGATAYIQGPHTYHYTNSVTGSFGTVGGGAANSAAGAATVSGGEYNSASGQYATVSGGYGNAASGGFDVIGGGEANVASGDTGGDATVAGGFQNVAGADNATVGGGFNNLATNIFATVPGGAGNVAGGQSSFAAGNNAEALHQGAFVWADAEFTTFASTTTNQFSVRANGGVRFVTSGAGMTLDGLPVVTGQSYISTPGTYNFFAGQNAGNPSVTGAFNVGIGNLALTSLTYGGYNEAVGSGALLANTSGYFNSANGYSALQYNTNGSQNTALGFQALYNNSSGNNNTASGGQALFGNTTGGNNTADGYLAMNDNNVGSANTAVGGSALYANTNGYNNSALGYESLYTIHNGADNVAVGVATLQTLLVGGQNTGVGTYDFQNLTNGSFNVGLGYYAGNSLINGSDNIYIGNPGLPTDNNVIRIGNGQSQMFLAGVLQGNPGASALNVDPNGFNIGNVNSNALTFGAASGEGICSARSGTYPYDIELWTDFAERLKIAQGGNVGIGTDNPTAALDVNGEFMVVEGLGGVRCYLGDDGSGNDVQIGSLEHLATAVSFYNNTDKAYMHLYCSSITIEGGADLAEPFQITKTGQPITEGEVVVIDDANPGQLKLTDQPYDARVAGVVSGANGIHPGIQMQQQGLLEGGKNVALTGRVYVQADTSNGPIFPGDQLTTSRTPGRAMRVTDHARAQGAILGKAMTGLKSGHGLVLVLVTLQ